MIHCELSAVGTATEPDLSQSIMNALCCPKKPNMLLIQAKTECVGGGRTQRYIIANSLEANLPVAVKKTENYRFFKQITL